MTTINRLAQFVSECTFDSLPSDTVKKLKLHLLDTMGAMVAGNRTIEGAAIGKLVSRFSHGGDTPVAGYTEKTLLLPAIISSCAVARCTEIDDIHLASCTTPGSVVVPTALSLARAGFFSDPREFMVALAIGYELLIRLGVAIDGPNILYRGIWPTYMAAPLGSAAVAARALKLDKKKTADALACALTMSTGIAGRIRKALSSRWLTLGLAAQNGVVAAFSAEAGFAGDDTLLDRENGPLASLVERKKLLEGLGERFLLDETCMKPYPVARQALAAIEAFREIIARREVDPGSIEKVTVLVPGQVSAMIDNPKMPENRLESIMGVQYQISLASLEPALLLDIEREPVLQNSSISAMMARISVKGSPELDEYFPQAWPARVEVIANRGLTTNQVIYPKGDWNNPFSWDEVVAKFRHAAFNNVCATEGERTVQLVDSIDVSENLSPLQESFKNIYERSGEQ